MRFTKGIVAAAIGFSLILPGVTQAAGLTSTQISAVLGLLQSFNVDAKTINTVQAVLSNTPNPEIASWTASTSAAMGTSSVTWVGASSTPPRLPMPPGQVGKMACITLSRNLGVGSQGSDVKSLQEMLAEDPNSGFQASTTGFFGPATAKAVMHFQMENDIASTTNGSIGPLTRGFFERSCGNALGNGGNGQGTQMLMGTSSNASGTSTIHSANANGHY